MAANDSEYEYVLIKPGDEQLWDSIDDCPFPLSELRPPYPLRPEDIVAIEAQKK